MSERTYRIRHMTIQEHAHTIAANWVYSVYAWRGRSPQFMQAQVKRLAEEIAAAETIAYEAGADEAMTPARQSARAGAE